MLIDNITTNHQFEIQQILKDAAVRIGKFKEIVDTKQNQVNNEVIIEKLTKKYEQEKGIPVHLHRLAPASLTIISTAAQALSDYNSYKTKISEREMKLGKEFQSKFDVVKEEISRMNGKFNEKIGEMEKINQDLRRASEDSKTNGSVTH